MLVVASRRREPKSALVRVRLDTPDPVMLDPMSRALVPLVV